MSYDDPSWSAVDGLGRRTTLASPWLFVLALLAGVPLAYVAWSGVDVTYSAQGHLWIETAAEPDASRARSLPVPYGDAWLQLLRSYQVLEPVVLEHRLHVRAPDEHAQAFADFGLADEYRPGSYELRVGRNGEDYALFTGEGALVQRGVLGEPVGQSAGFAWSPPGDAFGPGSSVAFSILTPRDAAVALSGRLETVADRGFLGVGLTGSDAQRTAEVTNSLMEGLVEVAARLQTRKLEETVFVLEEQLAVVGDSLAQAERRVEAYRRTGAGSSLEEARLRRRVQSTENLYHEVRRRVEMARLDRAMATPDVRIVDLAAVPERPSGDMRLPVAVAIFLGWVGVVTAGALLLGGGKVRPGHGGQGSVRRRLDEDAAPVLAIFAGGALAALLTVLLSS